MEHSAAGPALERHNHDHSRTNTLERVCSAMASSRLVRAAHSFISDINEARKLELARSQPTLNFLAFSPSKLLSEIHADLFPDVSQTVRVDFVTRGPLACIGHTGESASIYIHQLLNHGSSD